MIEHVRERASKGGRIARSTEKPGLPRQDDLGDRIHRRRDNRDTERHRLGYGTRQSLVQARHCEDVKGRQQARYVRPVPKEVKPVSHPPALDQPLRLGA